MKEQAEELARPPPAFVPQRMEFPAGYLTLEQVNILGEQK
jgi:hypothetical protein